MLQEFNKVTTTSNFIKNLLISTYLPLIRTVRDFDFIIKDRLYVYKCEIIKCTKSGYLVTGFKNVKFDGERATYRVITEYYFGEKNDKLCTNYVSNSEGYDSITHERLGKYLRSLRDMYDLNLMPLYNCFSNQILQAHHISNNSVEKTIAEYNTKIYKVPIRFNTDYTICMDNLGMTTFAPAFIKNNNLILLNNTRFGNNVDATNKYIRLHRTDVIQHKSNLRFKSPFIIRYNNIPETKKVSYYEKSIKELDYLHNSNYYQKNTETTMPRVMYYIRNNGNYIIAEELDIDEFERNKSKYYYSDNGIITQCTDESVFDTDLIYFILVRSGADYTYLPTTLLPGDDSSITLYIGVEPGTGRIDSTFELGERRYFWRENTTTVGTDIETWVDDLTLHMDEEDFIATYMIEPDSRFGTIHLATSRVRKYDSPNFETVCLWRKCTAYETFDDTETYYIKEDNLFTVWNYELDENTFNQNKSFYYIKDGDTYIQCTELSQYDSSETYYVLYGTKYITSKEYTFIMNSTAFYVALGFQDTPVHYYKIQDEKFIQLTGSDVFDMNTTYAIKPTPEIAPWKIKNGMGELVPTSDTYMVTGAKYYASHDLETKAYYVYDITEENCAMYDYLEDNLYLLIQVPKSYDSNITILEGDYTNTQSEKIIDDSVVSLLPDRIVDDLYTSNLKLMEMPSSVPVPFSDTLIEFLLWNAINNLDSINNNMDRLLYAISKVLENPFSVNHYANYWYPQYRKLISDIGRYYNNIVVTDNLGYVTKNLEQVINTTTNSDSYINEYPYGN